MNSIRGRLLAGLAVLLLFAAAVLGGVTYRQVLAESEALFDYQLRQMALSLRDQGEIDPQQAQALVDEDIDFIVQIWSADGRAIYASRRHDQLPSRALLGLAEIRSGSETWRTYGVTTGDRVIQVAQPVRVRQRLAADAAVRTLTPLLGLAPLLAAALWALAAWALRPLRQLAAGVRQRDAGSLAPLPATGLPDELAPLVQALNDLLGRLGASLDAQRAFVADAAHELRSPLTALKLQLHLLRRAADVADPAERDSAVDALATGIERAARLVEQLLALARSEPGAPPVAPVAVDLAALADEVRALTEPYARSRGSRVEVVHDAAAGAVGVVSAAAAAGAKADAAGAPPITVPGDPAALLALLRNLVDNALRYSPTGAQVRIQVARDGAAARLQVDDDGPGIPAAERERVFQRFVRGAGGSAESGSGLGLAIVRQVAERHGATLTLADSPLGGLRVTVRFGQGEASP